MRDALHGVPPTPLPGGALRDAGPMAQAAPPMPPADVPAPIPPQAPAPAPAAIPTPVTRPATAAAPPPPAQIQTQAQRQEPTRQEQPRAPRREQAVDQSNDLLPPASIPRSGTPQKGALERLFGG